MQTHKLSLKNAILININIIIGAGIFINTIPLAKLAGAFSPLIYVAVGLFMLPLILSITELLKLYPGGTFYNFTRVNLGQFWGFFSSWSYFTAKLASSTLMIHFSVKIIQSILPILNSVNTFVIDSLFIFLFAYLNMQNMRTGSKIQVMFMILKLVPILFVVLSGLYILWGVPLNFNTYSWQGIPLGVPLVMYAYAGFEASCSISRHIENSEKNAPKAVLYSFFIAVAIYLIYQFIVYQVINGQEYAVANYTQAIPLFISRIFNNNALVSNLASVFQLAIASSALGGAYGIMFSNNWNLFTIAENNAIVFSKKLKELNSSGMPYICLIVESFISLVYLAVSQGNNVPLQQLSAFGCTLTYLLCTISLFQVRSKKRLALFGILSSAILLMFCINAFITNGYFALIVFLVILSIGIIGYKNRNLI